MLLGVFFLVSDPQHNQRLFLGKSNNGKWYYRYVCLSPRKEFYRMGKHNEAIEDKLKRYSKLDPDTGCLIWLGWSNSGYGMVSISAKRNRYVHIVAWECVHGPHLKGFRLHHTCGNRLCINPQHMFLFKSSDEDSKEGIERQLTRLKKRVAINPITHCWEWQGAKTPKGYGLLQNGRTIVYAHRLMWKCVHGEVESFHVLHRCDNPCCINPEHLFLGTNKDNIQDKIGKNRAGYKLNIEAIKDIRTSKCSQKELAEKYGVRIGCIHAVLKRRTWKHVD
jgi:hypothetical protein